jgi:Uma2 family endonuclease
MSPFGDLGWLIDPKARCVYVYRSGQAVERVESPSSLSADPVLSGFTFNLSEIW